MPTLLVTGASGYLGRALCALARDAGWDVVGTHRTRPDGATIPLDVRDADAVIRTVGDVAPDAVVHTAYVQDDATAAAVNGDGAGHVARAAARQGARLVHVSSDAIFAGALGRALREEDVPAPVTAYGATKLAGERAVARAAPGAALVRTSLIYGGPPHEPAAQELAPLAAARGERPDLRFYADEIRSPIQVDDLAAACLELATNDWAGPLHVGGADRLSRLAFARLVVGAHGLDPSVLKGSEAPPGRPRDCALDSSRAAALLAVRLRGARAVLG